MNVFDDGDGFDGGNVVDRELRDRLHQRAQMIAPDVVSARETVHSRVGRRRRARTLGLVGALTLAVVVPVALAGGGFVEAGQWVRRTIDRVADRPPVAVVQATADLVPLLYPTWVPDGLELVDAGYFPEGAPPDSNPSFHLIASDPTGRLRVKIDRWTEASGYTGFVGAPGGTQVTADGLARPFVFPMVPVIPRKAGEHEQTVGWQQDDSVVVATVLGAAPESEIRALAVQVVAQVEEVPGGAIRLRPGTALTRVRYAQFDVNGQEAFRALKFTGSDTEGTGRLTVTVTRRDPDRMGYDDLLRSLFPSPADMSPTTVRVGGASAKQFVYGSGKVVGGDIRWRDGTLDLAIDGSFPASVGDSATILRRIARGLRVRDAAGYERATGPVRTSSPELARGGVPIATGVTAGMRWTVDYTVVADPSLSALRDAVRHASVLMRLRIRGGQELFVSGMSVSSTLQLHGYEMLERGVGDHPFQLAAPGGRTLIAVVVRPGTTALRVDGPPGFAAVTLPARLSASAQVAVAAGLLPAMPPGTTELRFSGLDAAGRTTWSVTRPAASVVR